MEQKRIGYWPDQKPPLWAVDNSWDPVERARVVEALKVSSIRTQWMGWSGCRFCGCVNGSTCKTFDGTWVFPEGYAHYIEQHGVRPSKEFVDHVLSIPAWVLEENRTHLENMREIRNLKSEDFGDKPEGACEHTTSDRSGLVCSNSKVTYHGSCQWEEGQRYEKFREERARNEAALKGFVKIP